VADPLFSKGECGLEKEDRGNDSGKECRRDTSNQLKGELKVLFCELVHRKAEQQQGGQA